MKNASINFEIADAKASIDSPLPKYISIGISLLLSLLMGMLMHSWIISQPFENFILANDSDELELITNQLESDNIEYRVDENSHYVQVKHDDLLPARLALKNADIAQGQVKDQVANIPSQDSNAKGDFIVQIPPSQKLEIELAKSISSIQNVRSSRIHLAIPENKDTHQDVRASVVLQLEPGRDITQGQISAISHFVASSVSGLSIENVTVIDQNGRLLKSTGTMSGLALTAAQFEYKTKLEASYLKRIKSLLSPVLGAGAYKAQVNVEMTNLASDITTTVAKEGANVSRAVNEAGLGDIRRLVVAVIVDNKKMTLDRNKYKKIARNEDEMKKIDEIVKKAVAYNSKRGDSVEITNIPFNSMLYSNNDSADMEWQGNWDNSTIKYIIALILLVLVFWGGFKVSLSVLTNYRGFATKIKDSVENNVRKGNMKNRDKREALDPDGSEFSQIDYYSRLTEVQDIVERDPKLVAQVIRSWVREDEQRT